MSRYCCSTVRRILVKGLMLVEGLLSRSRASRTLSLTRTCQVERESIREREMSVASWVEREMLVASWAERARGELAPATACSPRPSPTSARRRCRPWSPRSAATTRTAAESAPQHPPPPRAQPPTPPRPKHTICARAPPTHAWCLGERAAPPSPPLLRTNRTRRVLRPVLSVHAASEGALRAGRAPCTRETRRRDAACPISTG